MINPACWRTPATWRAWRASLTPSALFHLPIDLLPAIVCKGPNYVWQFSCDKLHKVSAFWLVGLKEETVSHSCGNLITSQGVDIDFFWMTLINCFSLRHRTRKYLKAKLMSQPKIRLSLIQCHVFLLIHLSRQQNNKKHERILWYWFIQQTQWCLRSFRKKGELGWESRTVWSSDMSVWSYPLNQRKHFPETKAPSADTAIMK